MTSQKEKAELFTRLHVPGDPLVLFNVWDAGSAKAVEDAGAKAIATGSHTVAAAHGFADGEHLSLDLALANLERIISTVALPVTIDFEGGYATDRGGLKENIAKVIDAGAVGINFEDQVVGGEAVSIPVLAWALSGFLYALPNTVEGGTIEKIDTSRVKVAPPDAISKANELAGKMLPTTALTLLMKDGRPQYQSVGGLGADSIFIDAETGDARYSSPPTVKTRFFREAHFYFFAGSWQVTLLLIFSGLTALSALTGIYLNIVYWSRRISRRQVNG